jgi:hypothetical protein
MAETPDLDEVMHYLAGRIYPANLTTLMGHAREKGADDGILNELGRIPEQDYNGPTAVRRALIELHGGDDVAEGSTEDGDA